MKETSWEARAAAQSLESVLPETLAEAEHLAASIERAVDQETGGSIHGLSVRIGPEGVRLRGRCASYYSKQLAQHAAMAVPGSQPVINDIEVV